jgi:hypothetical protein
MTPQISAAVKKQAKLASLMQRTKSLACEYHRLTGRPLGVTAEVAECEATEKLWLTLSTARTPFFDAHKGRVRFQIKGRAVSPSNKYRGRVPSIKCDGKFEAVLLVLLDQKTFQTIEIWRAGRSKVAKRLAKPGSKARNERRSMGITQFKSIARKVWP